MQGSNFKIYSASAGSGKTYALAKDYIKLLLSNSSPNKFRQILAITFTNKAVEEMKTRILENLNGFAQEEVPKGLGPLFRELCQELSLDGDSLRKRSGDVLKKILHNYSFFEISTIDKFNHKIVRTFARDLQLSQNFEVEMDRELILGEAVGRLLDRAGSDGELTRVLVDFSLEKLDEDKSGEIFHDLMKIAKLLLEENHWDHLEPLRSMGIADFKAIQDTLARAMGELARSSVEKAEQVLREIQAQGFEHKDFPRGTLPSHFIRISNGETQVGSLYGNKLETNLEAGKILLSKDPRDASGLSAFVLREYRLIQGQLRRLDFLKNCYGNILPMTVMNEILRELKNIELQREVIPAASLNRILSKEIKGQPVPFIYERMGEKYRHYFIDEFQDTSKVQWDNLRPLIANALEGESGNGQRGSLFLVGDVKQAIYRWRGGRAEGLLDLITGKSHPFVIDPQIHSLESNWRSRDQIVEFNNDFFRSIAHVLEHPAYRDLFLRDAFQKTTDRPGGHVQITFLEEEGRKEREEAHCETVLGTIAMILDRGHSHGDICVLVRDNSKGRLLADFLAQREVPIISSEALLLAGDEKVIFLISLLQLFNSQWDPMASYRVLLYLSKGREDRHGFIADQLGQVERLLSREYGFGIQKLKGESTFSILEHAIVQFGLAEGPTAHILFLMDQVLEVEKKQGPGVHAFLKHWEVKKESLSIAAPNGLDAVRIMTVHKAKGLEFPFVIFPFATSSLRGSHRDGKLWVPAGPLEAELGLEEVLVNHKKDLLNSGEGAAASYQEEDQKSVLDAINVLYVALTRPVLGLYVISEKSKESRDPENPGTYADLFQGYLEQRGIPPQGEGVYGFGSPPMREGREREPKAGAGDIPYITRPKDDPGFVISTRAGRLWERDGVQAIALGNLIHLALGRIQRSQELPGVLRDLVHEGHLPEPLMEEVGQKIKQVVEHPRLLPYFNGEARVMNEREILTPQGRVLRPDRVLLLEGKATLIDYKTGIPQPSHRQQIADYAGALEGMGLEIQDSILVYIDQKVEPVFI